MSHLAKVEFKPLNGSPSDQSDDDDDDDIDVDDDDLGGHSRIAYKKFQLMQDANTDKSASNSKRLSKLYIVSIIVILLFLANWNYSYQNYSYSDKTKVSNNQAGRAQARISPLEPEPSSQSSSRSPPNSMSGNGDASNDNHKTVSNLTNQKLSAKISKPTRTNINHLSNKLPDFNSEFDKNNNKNLNSYMNNNHDSETPMQSYETYMDTVLEERNVVDKSGQLDDLRVIPNNRYNIAKWWTVSSKIGGKYVTVTNYIRATKSFDHKSSVTFTTQASQNFLHHTVEICKRWDGPISVAVFGCGKALNDSITIIKYMRDCLPSPLSSCIKDKVSWHIIYESDTGPKPEALGYPKQHMNYADYKPFVKHDECPKMANQDAKQMVNEFSNHLANATSRQQKRPYPINVLRNVARLASTTKHLLACDIELYPSLNLVPLFTNYMNRHDPANEYRAKKYIFALPIFELKAHVNPPKTKTELAKLFTSGDAIFFHKFVCDYCQDFPNRTQWIKSLNRSDDDELSIFVKTQRDRSRNSWEPIFIGTNDDPLYDDRLTWDGRRDKMGQMYEMCLQDYYILIVDNAFLVHSPGIKHIDKADVMNRVQYIVSNNQIYEETMIRLKTTYAADESINKC